MTTKPSTIPTHPGASAPSFRSLAARIAMIYALIFAALFIPAGRLDWLAGWAYFLAYAAFTTGMTIWMARRDPGLLAERAGVEKKKAAYPRFEKFILAVARAGMLGLLVVAGLDAGRFGGSGVPVAARALGWVMALSAGLLILWVMRANTFASAVVRVQAERGHRVIEDGPYRYVRHPMYLGNLALFLGLPLALGSWWACIPAALLALTFIYRTAQEDRYLCASLDGYAAFTTRTRYRLLPGVW